MITLINAANPTYGTPIDQVNRTYVNFFNPDIIPGDKIIADIRLHQTVTKIVDREFNQDQYHIWISIYKKLGLNDDKIPQGLGDLVGEIDLLDFLLEEIRGTICKPGLIITDNIRYQSCETTSTVDQELLQAHNIYIGELLVVFTTP